MRIEERKNDLRVTMNVEVNDMLKQWVMFFGNIATAEKPQKLRNMILDTAKQLVQKYE